MLIQRVPGARRRKSNPDFDQRHARIIKRDHRDPGPCAGDHDNLKRFQAKRNPARYEKTPPTHKRETERFAAFGIVH
jgi:hypothetical protein